MAYNKVVYDGRTLVDLTADTVDASVLLAGYTAHGKDGSAIVGTFDPLNMFYPVGSYYETSDISFDPNTAWGGTWVLEAEGQVHVSAGSTYTAGDTGGSETHYHATGNHTLTVDEIPSHTHTFSYAQYGRGTGTSTASALQYSGSTKTTDARGGGQAHNHGNTDSASNMMPYIVVNRWHRTA